MILGLDISTSITGYTILDNSGNIVVCDHIDLRKEKNFFQKCAAIEGQLAAIRNDYFIEHIYIEQSLQSFRSGFSSAQTLSLLSKINGIVSWICYNLFGSEPQYLAATSARKSCGISAIHALIIFSVLKNTKKNHVESAESKCQAACGWNHESG